MRKRILWGVSAGLGLVLVIAGCLFVGNLSPTAAFTATSYHGTSPMAVAFDATGSSDPDGTIVEYFWDYGDGQTQSKTVKTANHTYINVQSDSKVFTVILTVTDNLGAEDTAVKNITVDP